MDGCTLQGDELHKDEEITECARRMRGMLPDLRKSAHEKTTHQQDLKEIEDLIKEFNPVQT